MKNIDKNSIIGILGCGWLGKPTAKALIKKGYTVRGTTTTAKGIQALKSIDVTPFVVELKPEKTIDNLKVFLNGLQVLIIAVPPKISQNENSLLESFKVMFESYDFFGINKLIYISSTGVFQDGIEMVYDEDSQLNNTTNRGKHLIALETIIRRQAHIRQCLILRYGGLIKKGGRHPVYYLSGRNQISNPEAPVNLIEQTDAVNLLCKLVESDCNLTVYHGVYPSHPNRKAYYTHKAKELNIELPGFKTQKQSEGKIVLSKKTQSDLNFTFKIKI